MNYRMQIHAELSQIPQQTWNSLLLKANNGVLHPAMRYEFLSALEKSGSVTANKGWAPVHLSLIDDHEAIVALVPMYLKSHSYGEYVFDWSWAQAYERNGMRYYPKLLSAIPFTPVPAPKLLTGDTTIRGLMAQAVNQFARECASDESPVGVPVSTLHTLFLNDSDQAALLDERTELMERHVVQFHWENKNPETDSAFSSFEDFLASLNRKKRKNIIAERRKVCEAGVLVRRIKGSDVTEDEMEFFYLCYARTYAEHHSTPYLNLDFFRRLLKTMPEQIMLVIASLGGQDIAASFFIYSEERLYGRYWGAIAKIPCLHFELCYYQAIEFAINEKIQWFEGGAQGEHKMARGLNPTTQVSAHWVQDAGFIEPIRRFLERERQHLDYYVDELEEHQAFKGVSNQT